MSYQAILKKTPAYTVFYKQGMIHDFSDMTSLCIRCRS